MGPPRETIVRHADRILNWFAKWFASAGGVWQTFFAVMAIVIVELANPNLDPNGYWILFWLTVYSGLTQPALAYVGWQAGVKTDVILNQELQLIREELQLLRGIADRLGVE